VRCLIFSINYAPEPTGFAPHVTRFAESLVREGDAVTVVTGFPFAPQWKRYGDDRGAFTRRETLNGVDVLRVSHFVPRNPGSPLQRILLEGTFCASATLLLPRLRGRYDLVLYVGAQPAVAALASFVARLRGIPYIAWINDLAAETARDVGMLHSKALLRFLSAFEYRSYSRAAGAIVLADAFRRSLVRHGFADADITTIRSPIDVEGLGHAGNGDRFRRDNGIPSDAFVAMFAGTMGLKVGMHNVLDAALRTKDDAGLAWVFVGEGQQRHEIERRVAAEAIDNVRMFPLQPQESVPGMLAAADVLIVNQLRQVKDSVVPSKLLSYMAAAKPVVAAVNATSQAAEILRDADGGILVEPENPAALAEAVATMKRNSAEERRAMGERNRKYAETNFDERRAFAAQREFLLSRLRR